MICGNDVSQGGGEELVIVQNGADIHVIQSRLIKIEKNIFLLVRAYIFRTVLMPRQACAPGLRLHIFYQIQLISDIN